MKIFTFEEIYKAYNANVIECSMGRIYVYQNEKVVAILSGNVDHEQKIAFVNCRIK